MDTFPLCTNSLLRKSAADYSLFPRSLCSSGESWVIWEGWWGKVSVWRPYFSWFVRPMGRECLMKRFVTMNSGHKWTRQMGFGASPGPMGPWQKVGYFSLCDGKLVEVFREKCHDLVFSKMMFAGERLQTLSVIVHGEDFEAEKRNQTSIPYTEEFPLLALQNSVNKLCLNLGLGCDQYFDYQSKLHYFQIGKIKE